MKNFTHNHYNPALKKFAKELPTESVSKAEKYLWKSILSRKQTVERFLRQRAIDNFIVDFFAPDLKLIIEIDGSSHLNKGEYDQIRENKLKELGYQILRFTEGNVMQNLNEVIRQIEHAFQCIKENKF